MEMTTDYPGDHVVPDAVMVYDRYHIIRAPPREVWPWILQLGKGRGGWYLTTFWEKILPANWRATRSIIPQWQSLSVGDRVPDYGRDEYFDVVSIDMHRSLVYTTTRFGTVFTWALILREKDEDATELHLRFRGKIQSTRWKRRIVICGGDLLDWVTTAPMLAGLAERVERHHLD